MILKKIARYICVFLIFLLLIFEFLSFCRWCMVDIYERKSVAIFMNRMNLPVSEIAFGSVFDNYIDYIAVLEIPKIGLKRGLVAYDSWLNNVNYNIQILSPVRMPNEIGNFILASHSGNSKVAFFDKLYLLKLGDVIYVYYDGVKYEYHVTHQYEIKKNGELLLPDRMSEFNLVLTTCSKNKNKQLVVIASR